MLPVVGYEYFLESPRCSVLFSDPKTFSFVYYSLSLQSNLHVQITMKAISLLYNNYNFSTYLGWFIVNRVNLKRPYLIEFKILPANCYFASFHKKGETRDKSCLEFFFPHHMVYWNLFRDATSIQQKGLDLILCGPVLFFFQFLVCVQRSCAPELWNSNI